MTALSVAAAAGLGQRELKMAEAKEGPEKHTVVMVGGGSAGITAAAQLRRKRRGIDIAIIDPADNHYYQPMWTMVGGGMFSVRDSAKPMASVVPSGCTYIKDRVVSFDPEHNAVTLADGRAVQYEYLVVAAGLQVNPGAIKGLPEALGKNGVCSIYLPEQAEYVWEAIRSTKRGNAIFTLPAGPIKCGGAPQKIMYLAEDAFRDAGLRDGSDGMVVNVVFAPAWATMFGVAHFAPALNALRKAKGIDAMFSHELVEVRGEAKQAVFKTPEGQQRVMDYELLHVVPPMGAPDFLQGSPIADASGFVEVDKHTLQHPKYPNVFGAGDCTNLPCAKTAAAVASQVPVLVHNLDALMNGQEPVAKYDGYSSCPLITGKDSMMLLEFIYGGVPVSTFGLDGRKARKSYFYLKKYVFPWAYWNLMLKGLWYGRHHVIHPTF
ncbi:MAG: FAD/NAD(P)-binding oxidoreductase [archaeon]|nr:FAD/NAD(P)-binding oxidoreductase [archaeon]